VAPAGPLATGPAASAAPAGSGGGPTATSNVGMPTEAAAHGSGGTLDSVKGLFDLR
jgi:hypothetical protein